MATKIGTLQNPEKTEALLPRTCLKAVADKNGDYISEDVLASDINALKDGAISSLSATTEIDITSYFTSDTALTLNTSTVKAYVHGDYVYISIDVTISNTNIHRISIPNTVLPPPIVTCVMSTVDWGNDDVTSQHGVVQWSGTDTRIQLRVSSANIRLLASVTYLKAST